MALIARPLQWLLLLLLGVLCVQAQKVSKKEFDSTTWIPQYFEDTDTILVREQAPGTIWRSEDAGATWVQAEGVTGAAIVFMHPFDNQVAYALSPGQQHWVTYDQGRTWTDFWLPDDVSPSAFRPPHDILTFHASDSKKVIFNAQSCFFSFCTEEAWYTLDGFVTQPRALRDETRGCMWARNTPEFKSIKDEGGANRVLCIVKGKYSSFLSDQRLMVSDDFFEHEDEPNMSEGRTVQGIISIASAKGYLMAAARAEFTLELALFVSMDGRTWHRAEFETEHKLEEDAYTVLESTNYSMQIVVHNTFSTGVLLSSNSNGTYFVPDIEHINKDELTNIVDFEKVMGLQGIILVNVVDNWEEVEDNPFGAKRELKSKISFHDGKEGTWSALKAGDEEFHLHSVTDARNTGRIFSSVAPGLILGIGNTGSSLEPYQDGDLFVSNDAGHTWEHSLSGPHKYEFGDQGNILLAIPDSGPIKEARWSIDHGKSWETVTIDEDEEVRVEVLTTTPDSTSRRFIIMARKTGDNEEGERTVIYSIDFDEVLSRTCGESDFETFTALEGEDRCVVGHKQTYKRRKRNADCFVRSDFQEALPQSVPCDCSEEDFECDFNFVPENGKCKPIRPFDAAKAQCKDPGDTFYGPSGFRLIPGDDCKRDGGVSLDEKIERPCSEAVGTPANGKITNNFTDFSDFSEIAQKVYLERTRTSTGSDETVLLRTTDGRLYKTRDHGKSWYPELEDHYITLIVPHPYNNDAVFFLTDYKTVFYSYNRADRIEQFEVDHMWNGQFANYPMAFHQDYKDWFIWTGEDCTSSDRSCHLVSQFSRDRGDSFQTMVRYSNKCEFIKREGRGNEQESENLIFCEVHQNEEPDGALQLLRSTNFFADSEPVFDDIVDFATMAEFVIVAKRDEDTLSVNASVNGGPFAPAQFPPEFNVPHQQAYTVLQSETHAVFLHVTVETEFDFEYGRLIKSNSNGTFYVSSIQSVNRDSYGYVDFEKVKGIEGVSLVNIVMNHEEKGQGKPKKLQTRITHNDGADWAPLTAPAKDSEGRNYDCRGDKCMLQLHAFTEKGGRTYSSESAVGLLIGNGNVGEYLDRSKDKDATFISTDGGLNWKEAKKGKHIWAFGDQGSIIVIVEAGTSTNTLYYSEDEGDNWQKYQFADDEMIVSDLTTVPSDNSKNFLIWGDQRGMVVSVNVDFSGLRDRECKLNDADPYAEDQDYYTWSPSHPFQTDEKCLFGHVAVYHRKKTSASCWNGQLIDAHGFHAIERNCTCQRQDFECDFNYQKDAASNCVLVPGYMPPDHSQVCKDEPERIEYFTPTGYRRIPLDTCEGGRDLEGWHPVPCPNHEDDFVKKHSGLSGFSFFLVAIVLPFSVAGAVGWYVYRHWDGKFGAIRLGESGTDGVLDIDKPWIRYPVMAASAFVAVTMAIPGILGSAWRGINTLLGRQTGRYTTRASFARGRGDYTVVDDDEDELLGDDEDEEV